MIFVTPSRMSEPANLGKISRLPSVAFDSTNLAKPYHRRGGPLWFGLDMTKNSVISRSVELA